MESVNIFVSSKTTEFAEEREKIKRELEGLDKSITAFIFEDDARPSSTKSDEVYREEVRKCHVYVGLFKNDFSKATLEEYEVALAYSKEKLIYVNDSQTKERHPKLSEQIKKFHAHGVVKHYTDSDNIVKLIRRHVVRLLAEGFHLSLPSFNIPGFTHIYPNYFDTHTKDNFETWKKGFEFELVSIKQNKEFKRPALLSDIVSRLESQNVLILVGEMGSSKTTVLYETLCHFHESGYYVFRVDTVNPEKQNEIVSNFERLLVNKKKIFVACDNLLSHRILPLLDVIRILHQHRERDNIKFLMTARSPDFYNITNYISTAGSTIPSEYIVQILSLTHYENNIYRIPKFSVAETADFLSKYRNNRALQHQRSIQIEAETLNNETNGNAFLIKCFALQISLEKHIGKMLSDYLQDRLALETMMICSLFRLSDIVINNKRLEDLGVMNSAVSLEGVTLTRTLENSWLTLHTKWDKEFFELLFKDERSIYRHMGSLENSLQRIFSLKDEDIIFSIFMTLYRMIDNRILPNEKVDQIGIPTFVSKKKKSMLLYGLGVLYASLQREMGFEHALEKFDLSIQEDPQNPNPYNKKGDIFYFQGNFNDSIKMFQKAIDLLPTSPISYLNIVRPMVQLHYPLDQELEYVTTGVNLCKNSEIYQGSLFSAYNNLGNVYFNNDIPTKAEKYYKLSNKTRKNEVATSNLGLIYFNYSNYKKAFYYFSKALKMDPENPHHLEYAIKCLKILGKDKKAEVFLERLKGVLPSRYEEMIEFYSDPNWRSRQYPFGWRSFGDYPRNFFPV